MSKMGLWYMWPSFTTVDQYITGRNGVVGLNNRDQMSMTPPRSLKCSRESLHKKTSLAKLKIKIGACDYVLLIKILRFFLAILTNKVLSTQIFRISIVLFHILLPKAILPRVVVASLISTATTTNHQPEGRATSFTARRGETGWGASKSRGPLQKSTRNKDKISLR